MSGRLSLGKTVGLLALAGCAAIGDLFQEPDVHLNRVNVRGIGVTGGTLDLVVGVHNPNRFDLRGTKLQLGFDVENSHVGDVAYDDDFSVTQKDTTTLTLPVSFSWTGVGSAVRAALNYGEIPYTMKGQATFETPWGNRTVPFSHSGLAPLTKGRSLH
jgi:LEA14-like dessication related protein